MRLSEMAEKEIINVHDGSRRGFFGDADLIVDTGTGRIEAVIIRSRKFGGNQSPRTLKWSAIRKIGQDMIVIDHDEETNPAPGSPME